MRIFVLRTNPQTKVIEPVKDIIFESSKIIEPKDDIKIENYDTIIVTSYLDYIPYIEGLFKKVKISGEVKMPGEYLIKEGETIGSLIKRVGGLKDKAFIRGAVFTRDSLRNVQRSIMAGLAEAQERAILAEKSRIVASTLSQDEKNMRYNLIDCKQKALGLMKDRDEEGRIIIDLEAVINGRSDIVLAEKDSLYIPVVPDWVLITGAVYKSGSVAFIDGKPIEYYAGAVGGLTKIADRDEIYVIKPNGCVESKSTGYGKVIPGDIIVVPEKV